MFDDLDGDYRVEFRIAGIDHAGELAIEIGDPERYLISLPAVATCIDRLDTVTEITKSDRKCSFAGREIGNHPRLGQEASNQSKHRFVRAYARHRRRG